MSNVDTVARLGAIETPDPCEEMSLLASNGSATSVTRLAVPYSCPESRRSEDRPNRPSFEQRDCLNQSKESSQLDSFISASAAKPLGWLSKNLGHKSEGRRSSGGDSNQQDKAIGES